METKECSFSGFKMNGFLALFLHLVVLTAVIIFGFLISVPTLILSVCLCLVWFIMFAGLFECSLVLAKEHHGTRLVRFQLHIAGKHNEPYQTQTHRKDQGRHRNEKPKDYNRRKHYQMKEQGQKAIHLETTETTLFCFHIL